MNLAIRSSVWRRRSSAAAVLVGLLAYSVFAVGPIVWIALMSFKHGADIIAYPPKVVDFSPTLDNYRTIFTTPGFLAPFYNTFRIAAGAVIVSLCMGMPAAYAIARMRLPFREHIAFSFISVRFAPELFVILPLFALYRTFSLTNTTLGLIIAYQLITFPLVVWLMRSFYERVPLDIADAVEMDGGGTFAKFKMATRMSLNGVATSTVLAFAFAWNSYALPLVLSGKDTEVVTSAILGFVKFADIHWGEMAAGTLVALLPSLIITAALAGRIVDSMTIRAVRQ